MSIRLRKLFAFPYSMTPTQLQKGLKHNVLLKVICASPEQALKTNDPASSQSTKQNFNRLKGLGHKTE
jgi:hypothetical protein